MIPRKRFKNLSLQWRLTLMAAAITAIACISLTLILNKSATTKMDEIGNYVIELEPSETGEAVSMDDIEIFPDVFKNFQHSKQTFHTESILVMSAIILASSLLTYFITGKSLHKLKEFSENIENIQAQNLSEPLDSHDLPKEIQRLSASFNKMLTRLDEAFSAQKHFSANAAHELRTPLAVIQAKIDVFQKVEHTDPAEYQELLEMLEAQIERLSGIVNELLEMTEFHTAERTDRISLKELAEEVLCDLEYQAKQRNISLIQEEGNAEFIGNETLIYRAIFNLVENAIKYNYPGGKVIISIHQTDNTISVTVSDTGIGIPQECRDLVFDPFFRVDKSRSREMGGTGIGLAMVKAIAELHEGTVCVKDSSADGSRIVMELNRKISAD